MYAMKINILLDFVVLIFIHNQSQKNTQENEMDLLQETSSNEIFSSEDLTLSGTLLYINLLTFWPFAHLIPLLK